MDTIDSIIKLKGLTVREMLRKYFPVGDTYVIRYFNKSFKLRALHNHVGKLERGESEIEIKDDIKVQVTDIENGQYRWFVYTTDSGKMYGTAVMALLNLHEHGDIELEKM